MAQQRGRKSAAKLAIVPPAPRSYEFNSPQPPDHLGEPELLIWAGVFRDFELATEASIAVLTTALEAHMRSRECREAIKREGMVIIGRDGQTKAHPLLAVERDARAAWLSGIKALGLEL